MPSRIREWLAAAWIALAALAWSGLALAQQGSQGTQSTQRTTQSAPSATTTTTTTWLNGDWWMWAVGVAVFLIIVIALTTRSSRRV